MKISIQNGPIQSCFVFFHVFIIHFHNKKILSVIFRGVFALCKIAQFQLIFCGNFVERHSFSGDSGENFGNCAFPQNFNTRKLDKIMVFYAVLGLCQESFYKNS